MRILALDCASKTVRKWSGSNNPNWKGGKTEVRTCLRCGEKFTFHTAHSKGRPTRGKYCSRECKVEASKLAGKIQTIPEGKARSLLLEYINGKLSFDAFCFQKGVSSSALRKLFQRLWPGEFGEHCDKHRASIDTMYKRGRAFEYLVMRDLVSKGYWCLRSPASKGPADVVAIKPGEVLLVQCKSGAGKLRKDERESIVETAASIGATPLLAVRPARGEIKYIVCRQRYQDMEVWC